MLPKVTLYEKINSTSTKFGSQIAGLKAASERLKPPYHLKLMDDTKTYSYLVVPASSPFIVGTGVFSFSEAATAILYKKL